MLSHAPPPPPPPLPLTTTSTPPPQGARASAELSTRPCERAAKLRANAPARASRAVLHPSPRMISSGCGRCEGAELAEATAFAAPSRYSAPGDCAKAAAEPQVRWGGSRTKATTSQIWERRWKA
eukprot:363631-Chlamydomonas_euryale.AAC.14